MLSVISTRGVWLFALAIRTLTFATPIPAGVVTRPDKTKVGVDVVKLIPGTFAPDTVTVLDVGASTNPTAAGRMTYVPLGNDNEYVPSSPVTTAGVPGTIGV